MLGLAQEILDANSHSNVEFYPSGDLRSLGVCFQIIKYRGCWVVIRSQVSKCAEMFWKFLYSLLFYSRVAKPHISVHVSKERTCDYAKVQSPVPRTRGKLKTLKSKTARPVSLNCTR